MTAPHVIRLRGFWSAEVLPDGRTRFTRPFGRPRENAPGETHFLTGPGGGRVELNGELLGEAAAGFAFDITGKLLPRNTLAITTDDAEPAGVVLEIRPLGEQHTVSRRIPGVD